MISRVRNLLPPASLKLLYNSFIQPHIQYGVPIWGGCSNQSKKRIVCIQKRAIRTISKSYGLAHTEPRMKSIKILNFDDVYKQQLLTLTYDCVYKLAPDELNNFIARQQSESLSLRRHTYQQLSLRVPKTKTKHLLSSFSVKGPEMWNELPNELKQAKSHNAFKESVKRFFLNKYKANVQCTNARCKDKRCHVKV